MLMPVCKLKKMKTESFYDILLSMILLVEQTSTMLVVAKSSRASNARAMEITTKGHTRITFLARRE